METLITFEKLREISNLDVSQQRVFSYIVNRQERFGGFESKGGRKREIGIGKEREKWGQDRKSKK